MFRALASCDDGFRKPWFFAVVILVVLAYSASIYWIFRGKVKLDKMSY